LVDGFVSIDLVNIQANADPSVVPDVIENVIALRKSIGQRLVRAEETASGIPLGSRSLWLDRLVAICTFVSPWEMFVLEPRGDAARQSCICGRAATF
jgi:hypothetical protein